MVGIAIYNPIINDNGHDVPVLDSEMIDRISSTLSLLSISRELRPQCISTFRFYLQCLKGLKETHSNQMIDRPRLETAITACALIVARFHHLPMSIADAAAWASIDAGLLQPVYYQIAQLVSERVKIAHSSPSIYFSRVMQAARCSDQDVLQLAERLLPVCLRELIVIGRPGSTIAAAVIVVAFRSIHHRAMTPHQITRIETELNLTSIRADVDYILASLSHLASLLPFNAPFGPDSLDLYLPELIFNLDQLESMAKSEPKLARACGPYVNGEVINRMEVARAVIRVCRRLPRSIFIGELPIDIFSDQFCSDPAPSKSHLDNAVQTLILKSVPLAPILNGEYRI